VRYLANNPKSIFFALKGRLNNASAVQTITSELSEKYKVLPEQILPKLQYIEHHRSHMASSFFASPFNEAVILSIDGSGDFTTTMMGIGRGTQIEVLQSVDFPHSLGIFYTAFTQMLGFRNYGDEYKVMGLAPYGTPTLVKELGEILKLLPDGTFSPRSLLIVTYALCGVANLASVGLLVSTIGTLCPERRAEAAGLGVKSWIAGNLTSAMTGAWIGLVSWGGSGMLDAKLRPLIAPPLTAREPCARGWG
jgi:hypothetical protein